MGFLGYFNPLRPVFRTISSVKGSSQRVGKAFSAAREALELAAERRKKLDAISGRVTPAELFAQRIEEVGEDGAMVWTPEALVQQRRALRRARRIFVGSAYSLTPLIAGISLFMPWWVALLLLPCALIFFVALVTKAAKHAWWEWQIEIEALESFTIFGGRKDFFKRVLWW